MNSTDWVRTIEGGPHADQLDVDVRRLDIPGATRSELLVIDTASAKRARGLTLRRGLLGRNIDPAVRDILNRFARDLAESATAYRPKDQSEALIRSTHAEIRSWALQHHMEWVLDAPFAILALTGGNVAEQNAIQSWSYAGYSLAVVLRTIEAAPTRYRSLRQLICDTLSHLPPSADAYVAEIRELQERIGPAQSEDGVGRWTRTAFEALTKQVVAGEIGLAAPDEVSLRPGVPDATAGPCVFSLDPGWDGRLPVPAWPSNWQPQSPSYGRVIATAALVKVIETVHAKTPGAAAAREAINMPSWHRMLLRLDDHLMPSAPVDASGRVLVFRFDDSLGTVSVELGSAICNQEGKYRARAEELFSESEPDYASPDDLTILRLWRRLNNQQADTYPVAEALVGHPRVLRRSKRSELPIPVRRATIGLDIDRSSEQVSVRWTLNGRPADTRRLIHACTAAKPLDDGIVLMDDSGISVVRCTNTLRSVLITMGTQLEAVDLDAAGPILARLQGLSEHVDVHLGTGLRGEEVQGDTRLVVRARFDEGLWLQIGVSPLPEVPRHAPGQGAETLHTVRNGKPVYVRRDLHAEVHAAHSLANSLGLVDEDKPFTWVIANLDAALSVVHTLADTPHRLELDGSLPRTVTLNPQSVTLRVGKERGWFTIGGRATSSVGDVDLQALLAAIGDDLDWVSTGTGYVRLTDALRDALSGLHATRRNGRTALSTVHVPLIDALAKAGVAIDGVAEWLDATERVRAANTLTPTVPDTLKGTLRSYQTEGFQWMARLAHWAPGAVLADDMGLGKTIQSIALLLRRATDGPALVVAPTSVGFNWMAELARFAPSLNAVSYRGSDREALLADVAPGTVLVSSYGILVRDAVALATHSFATVVFDEAQALKNPASQRTKAAMALDAGFRLGLSGTPVENHVGDLWSVLACTARGLLGTHSAFRDHWARPIDNGDTERRRALATLVSPFLLRRTKTVVAPELPDRTEVVHRIALSDAHRALYERSRILALGRIANTDDRDGRFQILAELTRLRQMACDPRLSDPTNPVVGGKVRHLVRRLNDIRESGEKALVFSLFVSHLELARDALTAEGFRVQWLTGSTSTQAREAAVQAFQRGDADVFLLSTKAGGTGLNLTAASYVFHMDPWWNPAAEDQATDRAHRIGQDKPVTVYRLIAADTVEERMLDMQADKRELVDALLSDSGRSAPLSIDALRDLLSYTSGSGPPQ